MVRILVTAKVENSKEWEAGFRTHRDLFKSMTVKAIHYAVMDGNEIAICMDATDQAKYFQILDSKAAVDSMTSDGVKLDTVNTFVLDKKLDL
jgi:hypothetical protein